MGRIPMTVNFLRLWLLRGGITVSALLGTLAILPALAVTGGCAVSMPDHDDDDDDDSPGPGPGTDPDPGTGPDVDVRGETVFAVIGDYGDDDDNTRAVANMIKSWNPDFILTTGDNDYSDGAFKGTFVGLEAGVGQYFHEFIGNYKGSEGPGSDVNRFFPTPGDHDWGDTCDDPTGLDDYLDYFTLPDQNSANERYYDYRQGDIHFFSVHGIEDCEPDGATADSAQAAWVRETAPASDAPFKIAHFHKPPYTSGARHIGEGEFMRWPWGEWGFDMVLSGDDHVYERIERDGLIYIINGLGGVDIHEFQPTPIEGSQVRYDGNYGAMRVDVFEGGMVVRFIAVTGTEVDRFTLGNPTVNGSGGAPDDDDLDPDAAPVTSGDWYRPDLNATWQWRLQPDDSGTINTGYDVEVYDIDLFDTQPATIASLQAEGRHVICYFSAGSYEEFRDDAGEFLDADLGNTLDGFADERWLDVRSTNVHRIMRDRLDLAAEKGCDGVEPDNVDGYQNDPGFPLTATDQRAFNRFIANQAHRRGLAVALKNDLDQVNDLVAYFDFAVNEQCHEFDECAALAPFIEAGKPVFNAEYAGAFVNDDAARAAMCARSDELGLSTLVLPLELDDSFRIACGE